MRICVRRRHGIPNKTNLVCGGIIMNIEFEELTHQNFSDACNIDRDDIPEGFVDTASTIMDLTDYGVNHHCIGHTFVVKYHEKR